MRAISVKQPHASLIVRGFKRFETRSWPAPGHIVGERVAICASKRNDLHKISPELRELCARLGLFATPLPFACVVGVVTLARSIPMTPDFIGSLSDDERAAGHYEIGNFAWQMVDPEPLAVCAPIKGRLGFFEWEPT